MRILVDRSSRNRLLTCKIRDYQKVAERSIFIDERRPRNAQHFPARHVSVMDGHVNTYFKRSGKTNLTETVYFDKLY